MPFFSDPTNGYAIISPTTAIRFPSFHNRLIEGRRHDICRTAIELQLPMVCDGSFDVRQIDCRTLRIDGPLSVT